MRSLIRNLHFRVGLVLGLLALGVLVVLPLTPITIKNDYVDIDTRIGGYYLGFFGNRYTLDLRDFKKGLDLNGGVRVVLRANMDDIEPNERANALDSAREIISRRVNYLGVSEPNIIPSRSGDDYRITVELPGYGDIDSAVSAIGQTAQLKFKQLRPEVEWTPDKFQEYYFDTTVWEDTIVTGADLRGADVIFSGGDSLQASAPSIQLKFSNEGRQKFVEVARANINKPVALFLDEDAQPLSMPIVSPDLAQGLVGDPVISGSFDVTAANALSVQIRAGALPVPVEILQQETIGATLGEASVQRSFKAGVIGLAIILVFMVMMYGRLGLVADFALILYAVIVLSLFKLIPVVLTLPGIAGFLLSIGMAVDANILIFERIREELKWGRPRSLAVTFGFERAWSSIRDSNVSSLLTAFLLFYFGSGSVRGFALTLSIGILVSLFTAIFVTRTLIEFVGLNKDNGRFDFVKKLFYKFSQRKTHANN